jgi:hypothetical protein
VVRRNTDEPVEKAVFEMDFLRAVVGSRPDDRVNKNALGGIAWTAGYPQHIAQRMDVAIFQGGEQQSDIGDRLGLEPPPRPVIHPHRQSRYPIAS